MRACLMDYLWWSVGEADLLHRLSHPNIIRMYTAFVVDVQLHIVMQYAEGGTLATLIEHRKGEYFRQDEVLHYFTQILLALHYLHSKYVCATWPWSNN